jgi:hypothetical protein
LQAKPQTLLEQVATALAGGAGQTTQVLPQLLAFSTTHAPVPLHWW